MEARTKAQRGSPSRDRFKFLHKQILPRTCWGLNSDLELVEKEPRAFIVARLDFKLMGDTISFAEAISYKQLIDMPMPYTVPVYIVEAFPQFRNEESEPETHRFNVFRLLDADYRPNPPKTETDEIAWNLTWDELSAWEQGLRKERKAQMAQYFRANGV